MSITNYQGALVMATGIDNTGLYSGFKQAENRIDQFGDHVKKAGDRISALIGVGFGVAGLKAFASEIVNVRGEIQMLESSFDVLLGGKGTSAFMSQMKQFAVDSPLSMNGVANAAQTLLGFGVTAENVIPTIKRIGDISMGNEERFKSLSLAFAQMSATGKLMGQDLLQMINAGFNPLQTISEKTGKSIGELKKQMEAGAISSEMVAQAFADATAEGGKFYGMTQKQAEGIKGLQAQLEGGLQDALNDIGKSQEGLITGGYKLSIALVENYKAVGEAISALVIGYGSLKAAMIFNTAVEKTVATTHLVEYARGLEGVITTEQKASLSKQNLKKGTIEYAAAVKAEVAASIENQKTKLSELVTEANLASAKKAAAQQELSNVIANTNAKKVAAKADMLSATQQVTAIEAQIKAQTGLVSVTQISALETQLAAAKKAQAKTTETYATIVNEAATKKETAQIALNNAAKELTVKRSAAKVAAQRLDTISTVADTAATAANTAATNVLAMAKTRLMAVMTKLNAVIDANKFVLIGTAVAALGYSIYKLATYQTEAEKAQKKLNDSMREAEKSSLAEQRELAKLKGELEATTKGTKEYSDIRDKIVSKFGQYHANLKNEIDTVGILDGTYRKLSKAIELSFGARQYTKFAQEQSDHLDKIMSGNLGKIQDKLIDKLGDDAGTKYYTKIREAILKGAVSIDSGLKASGLDQDTQAALDKISGQSSGDFIINRAVEGYIKSIITAQKLTDDLDKKAKIKFGVIGSTSEGESPEGKVFQNISKEVEVAKSKVKELQDAIADLRSGKTVSEDYKGDIETKTKELEETQKILQTLTGISKKELNQQAKELSTGVKAIRDGLLEAQRNLDSATTDENRVKYKEQIVAYENELEAVLNKVALLGESVVLNTIEGIIKGVNVEIGKFDTRTAQEKLFGTLDTSDLDKFRKGGNSGAKRSVSEWKDLRDVISKVDKELKEISDTVGGTAGEFISLASEVTTGTLSMVNDITRLSEISSESISKGATLASKAVSAVEKASVILSIISAAIQIFQKLQELLPDSHTQYLDFADKIGEINKLRDAVNEYEEAVLRARHAEEGWFATDRLQSLKQAREMHEEISKAIEKKLDEDQAKYQNEEGGGWSTDPYKWFIKNTYGKIYGFGQNDNDIAKAKENLRIETRAATSGVLGSGWFAKDQKTEDLVEWAKKNLGDDLFSEDNKLNLQVAETILKDYGNDLVGETKATLEYLVEMQKKYDEYIEQLRDYVSSLYEPLVDNFVDSLWSWFDEGKNALDSFKDYARDTFRDIVSDMMRTIILKNVVGDFDEDIADLYEQYAKDEISEAELAKLVADRTGQLSETFEKQLPVLQDTMNTITDAFENIGIDLKNTDTSADDNTLKGAYAKASQESIDLLAGQTGAARVALESVRENAIIMRDTLKSMYELNKAGWDKVDQIKVLTEKIEDLSIETKDLTAKISASNEDIKNSAESSAASLSAINNQGVKIKTSPIGL